jgi:hypothetical protein
MLCNPVCIRGSKLSGEESFDNLDERARLSLTNLFKEPPHQEVEGKREIRLQSKCIIQWTHWLLVTTANDTAFDQVRCMLARILGVGVWDQKITKETWLISSMYSGR